MPPQGQQQGGGGPAQQQQGQNWSGLIFRLLIIYFLFNFFTGGRKPPTDPSTGKALPPHRNAWTSGQIMDFYVYFSDNAEYFDRHDPRSLVWQAELSYDWNEKNNIEKPMFLPVTEVCISFLFTEQPLFSAK